MTTRPRAAGNGAGRKAVAAARKPGVRERAAQATRDSLLRAATKVFARHGLSGGSVEQISKAAHSYDRMIYYYFGSKEGLYIAVLEDTYRRFNEAESALRLDPTRPVESLQAVVRFALDYYREHPEFVTLLNNENLHRGRHIGKSLRASEYSSPAVGILAAVLESGVGQGLFRPDLRARDLYLMVAALGYFYQSNRHTLSAFLGEDLESPQAVTHWRGFVTDAVLRTAALLPNASIERGHPASAAARTGGAKAMAKPPGKPPHKPAARRPARV